MSIQNEIKDCPRCDSPIPNREHAGMYAGAISRVDNMTEICSECGVIEAMNDFAGEPQRFCDPLVKAVLSSRFNTLPTNVPHFHNQELFTYVSFTDVFKYAEDSHPVSFWEDFVRLWVGEPMSGHTVGTTCTMAELSRRDIVGAVKMLSLTDDSVLRQWRMGVQTNHFFFSPEAGNRIMQVAMWDEVRYQ
jgi:hypothetical protein